MSPRSLGWATTAVLAAVRAGRSFGADIMEATDLSGGSVYKILRRMERRELLESRWEDAAVAEAEGRPRRRYYVLTEEGEVALAEALERFRTLTSDLAAEGEAG